MQFTVKNIQGSKVKILQLYYATELQHTVYGARDEKVLSPYACIYIYKQQCTTTIPVGGTEVLMK